MEQRRARKLTGRVRSERRWFDRQNEHRDSPGAEARVSPSWGTGDNGVGTQAEIDRRVKETEKEARFPAPLRFSIGFAAFILSAFRGESRETASFVRSLAGPLFPRRTVASRCFLRASSASSCLRRTAPRCFIGGVGGLRVSTPSMAARGSLCIPGVRCAIRRDA